MSDQFTPIHPSPNAQRVDQLDAKRRALLQALLKKQSQAAAVLDAIAPRPNQDEHPLSLMQEQVWLLEQMDPDGHAYNMPAAVRLSGVLDVAAWKQSLNAIVRQHEVLRASFPTHAGLPQQVIAAELHLDIPIIDLTHLPAAEGEAEALRLAVAEAERQFHLPSGPLIRSSLLRLSPTEHIALLTMHHIVCDGWSLSVLVRELATAYDAYAARTAPDATLDLNPLLPPSIQYADFAHWQRQQLQGDTLNKLLDYWRKRLADLPASLNLPTDHPRPAVLSTRGAAHRFSINTEVTNGLRRLVLESQTTLYAALLSAYQILLFRYSGQDDISVGSPFANREKPEIESLIGFFVNMVVLRSDLSGEPDFRQLLQRTRQVVEEAQAHQSLPFEMLVAELRPERSPSRNPMFQAALAYQNTPRQELALSGLKLKLVEADMAAAKMDLTLVVEENGHGLDCLFRYSTDLFESDTIVRMAEHFQNLLASIVAEPDRSINTLPLLSPNERQQLLATWNDTARDLGPDCCAHELFEAQAALTPNAIAIDFVDTEASDNAGQEKTMVGMSPLRYGDLDRRANQLAHFLRASGVQPGDLVGLGAARSPEMLVGLLGILKAGAAFLPLDPEYPQERLELMLADSGARVLLTDSRTALGDSANADLAHSSSANVYRPASIIHLDADWPDISKMSDQRPEVGVSPTDLAYVIYTSGSTGRPKGVMVEHRSLVNHARALTRAFGLDPADRVLQFITLSFDAALEEIFPALASGAALVMPSAPVQLVGGQLFAFCERHGVTVLHLPAAVWHQAIDDLLSRGLPMNAALKVVLTGGERPDLDKLRRLAAALETALETATGGRPIRYLNAYGPTETTITATLFETLLETETLDRLAHTPIGRPISNVRAYVLDASMQPAPIGVPGELYIGGAGVARGYLGQPDLTRQRFVSDPFAATADARLYRTGDLARFLPDGQIEFLGRADDQVKIRGYRIELGEIETVLKQHPDLRDAAVVASESASGFKQLTSFVAPATPALAREGVSVAELLAPYLQARLPSYMVPSNFVLLPELPLLPNGKIDRRALLALAERQGETPFHPHRQAFVAPRDELEHMLAEMWQELLHIDLVGIHDNFFEIGGNSILGATFVNRLQERLGEYVYLLTVFDAPTIAKLSAYLRRDYATGLARVLGESAAGIEATTGIVHGRPLDENDIKHLRGLIRGLAVSPDEPKNPSAAFVLSAPRSGSTLFRAILGGNPHLFAPPELQLLNFDTLAEQASVLGGERDSFWLDGAIRALMSIHDCDAVEARRIMQGYRDRDLTVKQFFGVLQEGIGDRMFVDKTPNYALDVNIMRRIEQDFENPRYLFLIRHPYAVIQSFEKAKLHVFYPPFLTGEHAYTSRQLAELVWVISNQNTLQFLQEIPNERQLWVRYEDLVRQPQANIEAICTFLGIEFHPDMLQPQKNPKQRMTDPIHPLAKMLGDVRFFEHEGIDSRGADSWLAKLENDFLSDMTWALANSLGYDRQQVSTALAAKTGGVTRPVLTPIPPASRDTDLKLSFAQQRLWFLDQYVPGTASYNVPVAVRLIGDLNVTALEQSIQEIVNRHEALRTTFPTIDGRPIQHIAPTLNVNLTVETLGAETEMEARIRRRVSEEARRPFDLAHGPLLRARLLRLAAADHVLMITMHHIVADGWSVGVFMREMNELYAAFDAGQPHHLPHLPIQYADYATWQREEAQKPAMAEHIKYWRQQLAGIPPILELPTDHPRPAEKTHQGALQVFTLPQKLVDSLKALGQSQNATLFMTLLASFQALLARYSGQTDIVVGTPMANRNRAEIEHLIGFFVNTLVMRTDFSDDPSFRQLLERVREVAHSAFAHQDAPFDTIVEAMHTERSASYTPLFQVMFVLQDTRPAAMPFTGLHMLPLPADNATAKFDLTLSMVETDKGIAGVFEYATELFEAATIHRMVGHLQQLLEGMVNEPDRPISRLPLLTPAELQHVLSMLNNTGIDLGADTYLHELFEAQAARTPDATAIIFDDQTLTYADLNARANQLAHYLRQLGVGPETLVGLSVERSPDMIVGLLGILKTGGAYLPLDPAYPHDRLRFIMEDSGAVILLTQDRIVGNTAMRSNGSGAIRLPHIVRIDSDWSTIGQYPTANLVHSTLPGPLAEPHNRAYVIYTSGSTGTPKGVEVTHRAIANHARAMMLAMKIGAGDRMLQGISLSFDAAGEEVYPTLLSGATLVLPSATLDVLAGRDLAQFCEQRAVTLLHLPAPVWHGLVDSLEIESIPFRAPLRLLMLGGDSPAPTKLRTFARLLGRSIPFINLYGPTEATITSTFCQTQIDADLPTGQHLPIGRPIANAQVYVLDHHLQPAPLGVPGELFIGGAGVARGYLGRPHLTADRFIPDPFGRQPGGRLYRTGDLVRYVSDSGDGHPALEFLGRVDDQVKIRGFRVEPGEIEARLRKHPSLLGAAVVAVARPDAPQVRRLVAYVVPNNGAAPSVGELRSFVAEALPEYMVPSAFVPVDALPLLPNGKLDKRALSARNLPNPDQTQSELETAQVAPRNQAEETLAAIVSQVLKLPQVSIHDNFFEMGGDSILSIQVVARANQAGLHLTPKQLFQAPTVAGLAALAVAAESTAVIAEQNIVTGPAPLTPIQRWFFARVDAAELPDPNHWNQSVLLQTPQSLNPIHLREAVAVLLHHHDALRLRFHRHPDGWEQVNAGDGEPTPFVVVDLHDLADADLPHAISSHASQMQTSLDISAGPLLRLAYYNLGENRPGRLLIVIHHLAIDGVSWRVLMEDLRTVYIQSSQGIPVRLPPKTTAFRHWASRLQDYARSQEALAELPYWEAMLAEDKTEARPRPALSTDFAPAPAIALSSNGHAHEAGPALPVASNTEADAASVRVWLSAGETDALLRDVPSAYGTEINDVLLTALTLAYRRWLSPDSDSVLVDMEGHGREDIFGDIDISRTVGWFTSMYPVRLQVAPTADLGDTLIAVKEQVRRIPHRGMGYGLLRWANPDAAVTARLAQHPSPEISFNYLGQIGQNQFASGSADSSPAELAFTVAPENKGPERSIRGQRSHPLFVSANINEGQLSVDWSYNRHLHQQQTIQSLAQEFMDQLRAIISHCQSLGKAVYTPSDFGDVELSQEELDAILAGIVE